LNIKISVCVVENKVRAMKRITIFLILILSISLTSCATVQTYEGEELPREEVAVIKSDYWGNITVTAVVREVDGKYMGFYHGDIVVLPGRHLVKIRVTHSFGYLGVRVQHGTVLLHAEAGHTYKVGGAITSLDPWVWIVDEGTNQVVAGRHPKRVTRTQIRDDLKMIPCRADDFPAGWKFMEYVENAVPPASPYNHNIADYSRVLFTGQSYLDMCGCHLTIYKSDDTASEAFEWYKKDFANATVVRQVMVGDEAMYSHQPHSMGGTPHIYDIILRRNSAFVNIRVLTSTAITPEEISLMLMKIDARLLGLTKLKTH
jgi:hypothetical protein